MKSDTVYINQMLESVVKIESFTTGFNHEKFLADAKTQSAVIMQLLLIGEISKKISAGAKEPADIPWKDIAGFRDKAIHNYFDIDLDIVWNTITDDIPILKKQLQKLV